jgi:PDZ domain-containing protein
LSLFADDRPAWEQSRASGAVPHPVPPRSVSVGRWMLAGAALTAIGLSFLPAPYAVERPGPVFDTLGEVTVAGESVPLISIPGQTVYPTEGTLSMLTVNLLGDPENHPSWVQVVTAWADPSEAVVPLASVFPEGETVEQSEEQSAVDMQNSQKDAIAASLGQLGYDLPRTLSVAGLSADAPAAGVLQEGDVIERVEGEVPADVTAIRASVAERGAGTPLTIDILRDGTPETVVATPAVTAGSEGRPVLGVEVQADYRFPFDVQIQLENVGGPSAGMMFALGIIDMLTPGALTGGDDVAGTGTITSDGTVGPIGGIRQKLYGARDAGAEFFLAPAANCDEVRGHVPDGLSVFAVATLDDALAVLEAVADDGPTDTLPTCDVPAS